MRGIGEQQLKQQEKSEKIILKFMNDSSVKDPTLVQWCHTLDDTGRCFWLRGIVKGTNLTYNTVTKAVDRLLDKDKIWEWPNTHNVRIFQLKFEEWELEYNDLKKGLIDPNEIIKIPRGNITKQQRHILNKQLDMLFTNFKKVATDKEFKKCDKLFNKSGNKTKNFSESIKYMKKITELKFPLID